MRSQFIKDADSVLDYVWDWSAWLAAGETISTSTWLVPLGIASSDTSNTTTAATVWLSGGTDGVTYAVTNRITTNQGRTADRTISIRIIEM